MNWREQNDNIYDNQISLNLLDSSVIDFNSEPNTIFVKVNNSLLKNFFYLQMILPKFSIVV